MSTFTLNELTYLSEQRIGQLIACPHRSSGLRVVTVCGRVLPARTRYRAAQGIM